MLHFKSVVTKFTCQYVSKNCNKIIIRVKIRTEILIELAQNLAYDYEIILKKRNVILNIIFVNVIQNIIFVKYTAYWFSSI